MVIEQKHSTITITTTKNQKNEKLSNSTTIDLGDCETKLKNEYNISKDKSLYILKIDVKQESIKIPKIAYEVYYPLFGDNLIKLNLTACKDSKIEFSIPVALTDDIDKINPASDYYNDICYTYTSKDGTDISLSDRKNDFVKNDLSLCEENCDLKVYNFTTGKSICSCNIQTNQTTKIGDIIFDKDKLYDKFTNIKNIANINVLKCYKSIFNLVAYKYNYANLIMISIIFFFIITFFIFYCKDYYYLKKIIDMIVYFKLNELLVKIFLEKKRRKDKIKLKHSKNIMLAKNIKIKNERKEIIYNKAKEFNNNLKLPIPPNPQYKKSLKKYKSINLKRQKLDKYSLDGNKSKPNKKNKKNRKVYNNILNTNNKISFHKEILNKNNFTRNSKNYIINKKDYPNNMNENQMYEIFLILYNISDYELNEIDYETSIKIDKRTYIQYYLSLIRTNHLLFFSFWPTFDYNSRILKIFLFFFEFAFSFMVNALFFNDDTMHKIYEEKGKFDFIYNIPQMLYSSLISEFINEIIQTLALTNSNIIILKKNTDKRNIKRRKKETLKTIKIKFALFFIITLPLLVAFWFYLACFCEIKN